MVFHASAKGLIMISDCPGNKQAVYVATCWSISVTAGTTWHLTPGEDKVNFTKREQQNRFFFLTCVRHTTEKYLGIYGLAPLKLFLVTLSFLY